MSWTAFFWILYGAGSTLFVIYLFRLGKSVASNKKELIQEEIQRMRTGQSDEVEMLHLVVAGGLTQSVAGDDAKRSYDQHIHQPDSDYVAVQSARSGENCLSDIPVGQGDSVVRADSESFWRAEKRS